MNTATEVPNRIREIDPSSAASVSGGGLPAVVVTGAVFAAYIMNGGGHQIYDFTSGVLDGIACANGNTAMCP